MCCEMSPYELDDLADAAESAKQLEHENKNLRERISQLERDRDLYRQLWEKYRDLAAENVAS